MTARASARGRSKKPSARKRTSASRRNPPPPYGQSEQHTAVRVAGGSEARNWKPMSAHSYAGRRTRDVYIWIEHATVKASLCVTVRVPLAAEREGRAR